MNVKFRLLLIVSILTLLFAFNTVPAWACSCAPPPPPGEARDGSAAVFAGQVTAIEAPGPVGGLINSADPVKVTVQVSQVWKGSLNSTLVVTTARDSASCGYSFDLGGEYLVYAYDAEGELNTNLCSRTAPLQSAGEDLNVLGEGAAPPQLESGGASWVSAPILIGLSVLAIVSGLAILMILYVQSRRRA
jgi:hypothetical protein